MQLSYTAQQSSMVGTTGNSILGNAQKAILILFSERNGKSKTLSDKAVSDIAASELSKSVEGMWQQTAIAYPDKNYGEFGVSRSKLGNFRFLEVQYNPNTIQLQANAEDQPMLFLQQNLEAGVPNQMMRPPSVTLHVDLFFDAVNLADSFMWEKFTMGLSGQTVSNIATLAAQTKGKVWSVQQQTNGLLGAMMKKDTRFMIFKWADMTFAGELTEANAVYTMFSTSGRPVRSTVTLRITQNVDLENDIQYWSEALKRVIGKPLAKNQISKLDDWKNLLSFNF